jgi:hypothetical protein
VHSKALRIALVGAVLATAWVAFVAGSLGDPAKALSFGREATTRPLAEERLGDVFSNDTGYDGQYYWAIATGFPDLDGAAEHIDSPRYRYQRIVTPVLASPFGDERGPVLALLALGILGIALGCGAIADLAERHGRPGWVGLFFLVPMLYALPTGLAEPLAYGLGFVGVALLDRGRIWPATAVFTVAALTRESALLMAAAAAGGLLLAHRQRLRDLLPLVVAPAVMAVWWGLLAAWYEGGQPSEGSLEPGGITVGGLSALGLFALGAGLLGAWLWRDAPAVWPVALSFGLLVLAYSPGLFRFQVLWRANAPAIALCLAGLFALLARRRARNRTATAACAPAEGDDPGREAEPVPAG